eukprot:642301-Prymnesium_polylepis.1
MYVVRLYRSFPYCNIFTPVCVLSKGYGDEAREHGTRARTRERHEQGPTRNNRFSVCGMSAGRQSAGQSVAGVGRISV